MRVFVGSIFSSRWWFDGWWFCLGFHCQCNCFLGSEGGGGCDVRNAGEIGWFCWCFFGGVIEGILV
jgi:hypothetical protein